MEVKKNICSAEREECRRETLHIFCSIMDIRMKGRKGGKRISVRRKMLMNEQQETFNQQQYYYKNITGKSKANNFYL